MVLRLRDVLTSSSCIKFTLWHYQRARSPLTVTTVSGTRALIRPGPSTDYNVFYEVFVKRVYDPPASVNRDSVRLIVDLGANVGFSNLFWLETFPNAEVLTYEPHPSHVELATKNAYLNQAGRRLIIRPVAASTSDGEALLSNEGAESAILKTPAESSVKIRTVDLFRDLSSRSIDVLKIDIEGGEYDLACDDRFRGLQPSIVCMEAHPSRALDLDQERATNYWENYWKSAGYETSVVKGIIWALRS